MSAGDKAIGRTVYVEGGFDFEKVESVLRILGWSGCQETFVDVGANVGVICIPAVRRGLFRSAVAFEPDPHNFRLLQANIHLNSLGERITAHNIALGAEDGAVARLALSSTNHGDHQVLAGDRSELPQGEARPTVEVRSETLDGMLSNSSLESSLIWIDTQGFEGLILEGAKATLRRNVPLVLEFWPLGLKRTGGFPAMKRSLIAAGYTWFVDLRNPSLSVPLSEETLDDLYASVEKTGRFTDILVARATALR